MRLKCLILSAAIVLAPVAAVLAWHNAGHDKATLAAVTAVKGKLPAFFTEGAATIAHCSLDPDTFTRPMAPPQLHAAEAPEHYFDFEVLGVGQFPPGRHELAGLCAAKGLEATKVGFLPYAVIEAAQKLTVALAEHRRWPSNPHIQVKCLVYAGLLSHYAQDLCQPLHVTIHWDGRARQDLSSPRTGIHMKVDALLGKLAIEPAEVAKDLDAKPFDDLSAAVFAEVGRSHALVEKVYQLEPALAETAGAIEAGLEVEKFARERLGAAAAFTASLYLTAWRDSAKIQIPDWHSREQAATTAPSTRAAAASAPVTQPGL